MGFADEGHEHSGDRIKELIDQPLTIQLAIAALVISFVLGGLHALTPGHGKAIVAAYLVGSKGRVIDAVFLGLVVTFTHTFSVIALGVVMLVAGSFAPENVVPWLSLSSGILIVGIGAWLLTKNMKQYYSGRAHGHDHGHAHGTPYPITIILLTPQTRTTIPTIRTMMTRPDHDHVSVMGHRIAMEGVRKPLRPGTDRFLGSLLSLGVLWCAFVPCVDALIGLLFAISLNKLVWGLIILCAFSLGLAAVLVAIGILMVVAAPLIGRFTGEGVWLQRLPIFSAAVVILLGAILVFKALTTVGVHI